MVRDPVSKILDEPSLASRSLATQLFAILLKHGLAGVAIIGLTYYVWQKDAVIKGKDDKSVVTQDLVIGLVREQTTAITKQTVVMESLGKIIESNTRKIEELDRKVK